MKNYSEAIPRRLAVGLRDQKVHKGGPAMSAGDKVIATTKRTNKIAGGNHKTRSSKAKPGS